MSHGPTDATVLRRRFSPVQSDRILRLADVFANAAYVLGSEGRANRWLREGNAALGGDTPLSMLDTEAGARMVEELLGRIEYGIYS